MRRFNFNISRRLFIMLNILLSISVSLIVNRLVSVDEKIIKAYGERAEFEEENTRLKKLLKEKAVDFAPDWAKYAEMEEKYELREKGMKAALQQIQDLGKQIEQLEFAKRVAQNEVRAYKDQERERLVQAREAANMLPPASGPINVPSGL